MAWPADGSVWLYPAYAFVSDQGERMIVLAVPDDGLAARAPWRSAGAAAVVEPAVDPAVEPAPRDEPLASNAHVRRPFQPVRRDLQAAARQGPPDRRGRRRGPPGDPHGPARGRRQRHVVRHVVARIREQAVGEQVSQALDPGQQVVKIVNAGAHRHPRRRDPQDHLRRRGRRRSC